MKNLLLKLMADALDAGTQVGLFTPEARATFPLPHIERTRDKKFGDFSCNIAFQLAKSLGTSPRELATALINHLPDSPYLAKVELAGPGFINFFLTPKAQENVIEAILTAQENYGASDLGKEKSIILEFVSANPTGPLHVGHGRSAVYGSVLANLLRKVGYQVTCEYYINDAGRQADILAVSVWLRYLEALGEVIEFPEAGYRGEYINEIANGLIHDKKFQRSAEEIKVTADTADHYIDRLILQAKKLLGNNDYLQIQNYSIQVILEDIKDDLSALGVTFDQWYSERQLFTKNLISPSLERLKSYLYEQEGTLWFKSTAFGDDKDRVVQRNNGQPTYFASDIAYHADKLNRGVDKLINILGADHHGYVPRLKAAVTAMNYDPACLTTLLVQFAILYRGKERLSMSTRSGSFITLRELREEVGKDATRFFYVMRKCEQHLDFDLQLAKSQSNENPVYYIQYAHARICSVMKQLTEKNLQWDESQGLNHLHQLVEPQEKILLDSLSRYSEVIEAAAENYEPHLLTSYLRECANHFHSYYNTHIFLVEEETLRNSRLCLINATRWVLANGLTLLGITAPASM